MISIHKLIEKPDDIAFVIPKEKKTKKGGGYEGKAVIMRVL
jgi:hypothetical protein